MLIDVEEVLDLLKQVPGEVVEPTDVPVVRVAVQEAVVGRVDGCREQPPVQAHHVPFVVVLVLVAAALGDLDDDLDHLVGHGRVLCSGPPPVGSVGSKKR